MNPTHTRKTLRRQSRAALWTIQLAVDAVADSVRQLKVLRDQAHRGHRTALATLRRARHHALNDAEMSRVEDGIARFARLADWPATMRVRSRQEHLERPLSEAESREIASLAGSALTLAAGMLDIGEQLDACYGSLAVTAAAVARSAHSKVTYEKHRRRADKLMLRLDQLCSNSQIAWAFVASGGQRRQPPLRTLH
jgi:hypothetical protein